MPDLIVILRSAKGAVLRTASNPGTLRAAPVLDEFLKRSVSMPKTKWRESSTPRTLRPIESFAALEHGALQQHQLSNADERNLIACEVATDRSGFTAPPRVRQSKPVERFGALRIVCAQDGVKLKLDGEACAGQVYSPRRPSRHLATLEPWSPVRLVLNGRADWSSGRMYYLQDYYIVLCTGATADLRPTKEFDLQANLI